MVSLPEPPLAFSIEVRVSFPMYPPELVEPSARWSSPRRGTSSRSCRCPARRRTCRCRTWAAEVAAVGRRAGSADEVVGAVAAVDDVVAELGVDLVKAVGAVDDVVAGRALE